MLEFVDVFVRDHLVTKMKKEFEDILTASTKTRGRLSLELKDQQTESRQKRVLKSKVRNSILYSGKSIKDLLVLQEQALS